MTHKLKASVATIQYTVTDEEGNKVGELVLQLMSCCLPRITTVQGIDEEMYTEVVELAKYLDQQLFNK